MKYTVTITLFGKKYRIKIDAINSEEARAKSIRKVIQKMEVEVEPEPDDIFEQLKNILHIK